MTYIIPNNHPGTSIQDPIWWPNKVVSPNIYTSGIVTATPPVQTKIGEAFKPKKAGSNGSHVVLVVDESGSMNHLRASTISAVNEFIAGQRVDAAKTGIETFVSVYTFEGSKVKRILTKVNVSEDPKITVDNYIPGGTTNLNDAFGGVIAEINQDLASLKKAERPSVIIAVLTDGEENSSRIFTSADVKLMNEKCTGKKWAFMFLGANIDAFAVGASYGFNKAATMNFVASDAGVTSSIGATTRMANSMKYMRTMDADADMSTVYASTAFTDDERKKADKS